MKIQKLITSLAVVFFAGSAFAQTTTTTTTTSGEGSNRSVASRYSTTQNRSGWIPSVGLGFGHLDQSGNSDIDGDAVSALAIGTWYFDNSNILADAGIGLQKEYFRDSQPTVGLIQLSGRYEFPRRWSIGPVVEALIGTTEEFGSANNYLTNAGVLGMKELTFANDTLVRLGLKYTTEFGVGNQTSNFFGVVAQWGFGAGNSAVRSVTMNK